MEEVKKLIKIFNNAFNMLNRDIIQTTITKEQVLAIENLINKNKELEKMVELMAKYIQVLISKYEDDTYTYTSIIDYFKKKAKGE